MEKILQPMVDTITNAEWDDPVYPVGIGEEQADFSTYWSTADAQAAGYSGRLGSRLLDKRALTLNVDDLKAALKKSTPLPWSLLGHLTAGPGTHSPPDGIPGGSNAVGPGWRMAYTHVGKYNSR